MRVVLRKPLARSVRSGHPWLYRDALMPFSAAPGTVVRVCERSGKVLGRGLVDSGPIGVRVFSAQDEPLDDAFFARRIEAALSLRARMLPSETNAYRLLHGEGDRVPGIVCDRYGAYAVLKLDGAAALSLSERLCALVRAPLSSLGVQTLLVRDGQRRDGDKSELAWGPPPPEPVVVLERGMRLCANLRVGQKTGLFLDHRESRFRVRQLSHGLSVLNLYGYTGGFSVAAALGGAREVTTVDVAAPALAYAEQSFVENGLSEFPHRTQASDVPELLRELVARKARHDLVIADPPNFASSEAAKPAALASYEALHTACLSLLPAGGLYLAASCSSHVSMADFETTLRQGASRARKVLQVLERTGAPADHPRLMAFPEGDYLKVVLLRVA